MPQVVITPRARRDIEEAIKNLGLPANTWTRIARSLRVLEEFPLAGRALEGRWTPARFVLGPWPWMIMLYTHDEAADAVYLVAMHDARSAVGSTTVGTGRDIKDVLQKHPSDPEWAGELRELRDPR